MKMLRTTGHSVIINILRDERIKAGLRQIDLAEKLGVRQSFVSKYEVGERRLDIIEIQTICAIFDLTLGDFVNRVEKEQKKSQHATK